MSNPELEAHALALVHLKTNSDNALKGTLGYHNVKEQVVICEAILRAKCDEAGVDFDELLNKYE
jgi:hypothetical protein